MRWATLLFMLVAACSAELLPSPDDPTKTSVLVFSKTAAFRHESVEPGIAAIHALGQDNDWSVSHSENSGIFNDDTLRPYHVVVWLNTTGDVLDGEQQAAFQRYIRAGGAFVGVHAASDTEYDWPWYGELVGAYFGGHPAIQQATVIVDDLTHPATAHLAASWVRTDEWYNFRTSPRGDVTVLARVDEATYGGGTMGDDHPVAWHHEFDGGRGFYTAMGHTVESYADPAFRQQLRGAIEWAAND